MTRKEFFEVLKNLHEKTHRDFPICKQALLEAEGDFYKAKNLLETDPKYDWVKERLSKGCWI